MYQFSTDGDRSLTIWGGEKWGLEYEKGASGMWFDGYSRKFPDLKQAVLSDLELLGFDSDLFDRGAPDGENHLFACEGAPGEVTLVLLCSALQIKLHEKNGFWHSEEGKFKNGKWVKNKNGGKKIYGGDLAHAMGETASALSNAAANKRTELAAQSVC